MRSLSLNIGILAISLITGCATLEQMHEDHKARVCNDNGGFEHGMNDAREGRRMDNSWTSMCDGSSRSEAMNGYRRGYQEGMAAIAAENSSNSINVHFGGGGISFASSKYFCEVKAFMDTYSASGSTEYEARSKARQKCERSHHPMHCGDVSCSR